MSSVDNHLSLPRFSSRVVTLPSPSCAERCLSAHAWRCIRVCLCFRWVCVCARCQPAKTKEGAARERLEVSVAARTHTSVLAEEEWKKSRQTKRKRRKGGRRGGGEASPVSPWSAAKCTDRSDGNTQSVHLFEPAGRRYLSQWSLHPQTRPPPCSARRRRWRCVSDGESEHC